MAGDWIKMRTALQSDLRITRVARRLNNSHTLAGIAPTSQMADGSCNVEALQLMTIGALHRFWTAAQEVTIDGVLEGMDRGDIDCMVGILGFADALIDVGWLQDDGGKSLKIPNYQRHNGDGAKKRASTKERVGRHRDMKRQSVTDCNAGPLPEKRREEKRVSTKVDTKRDLPSELDFPDFHEAWSEWEQHRKEIKKKLTKRAVKMQYKKLAVWGRQRAIAAIEHSIANGYTGIFELGNNQKPQQDRRRGKVHDPNRPIADL